MIPAAFDKLSVPAIASPMFLVSGPDLVIASCRGGVAGTFPALNQRSSKGYEEWLETIAAALSPADAPFGVNMIVHRSNPRLAADLELTVKHRVPFVITSLGAVPDVVEAVHSYGGLVFHDVVSVRHAQKAVEAGVDGIIAVAAGAGGHAGTVSPFALISEIRPLFDGCLILSGAMNTGRDIAAARMMGADLAYLGTRFLATAESLASDAQKAMVVGAKASDVLYTPHISGVAANFLKPSLLAAGLDPDHLVPHGALDMENEAKAWKSLWSAGQGVGGVFDVPSTAELCERLVREYRDAIHDFARSAAAPFARPIQDVAA